MRGWLAVALALVVMSTAERTLACACCDGTTVVEAVGWSRDGGALLVDDDTYAGCEHHRALVALPKGDQRMACFANASDGAVSCGRARRGGTELSIDPHDYPAPVRVAAADHVRAELRSLPRATWPLRSVDVQVFASGHWTPLWKGTLVGIYPPDVESPAFEGSVENEAEMLVEIALLPAPDDKRGILAIANHDTRPGIGHFNTSLTWVDLPDTIGAVPGAPNRFETLPEHVPSTVHRLRHPDPVAPGPGRFAVFGLGGSGDGTIPRTSMRKNDDGLVAHRKGDFTQSARLFAEALSRDADNPFARYNLACSYARLGMPEHALYQLSLLSRRNCANCAKRLEHARTDEDLSLLRGRADFSALVCGDAGDCLPHPATAASVSPGIPREPPPTKSVASAAAERTPPARACHCAIGRSSDGPIWTACAMVVACGAVLRRRLRGRVDGSPT